MRSAATIDERTDGPDGRPIGGQWSWRHCSARRAIRERGLISKFCARLTERNRLAGPLAMATAGAVARLRTKTKCSLDNW